jgi:hypothetical protein
VSLCFRDAEEEEAIAGEDLKKKKHNLKRLTT